MAFEIEYKSTWLSTSIEDIVMFVIGGDWGKEPTIIDEDYVEVLCIRGSEIRDWSKNKGNTASIRAIKKTSLETRELIEGDILLEISGGGPDQPVGRTVLIDKQALSYLPEKPKVCTNFLRLLRFPKAVDSSFINMFFDFFYASGEIVNYQGGSNNLRNLKFAEFSKIKILLPPLNEQQRIVSKIEELFSELDNGVANLKLAQNQLKVYRQALLKYAFEGKLTEQWRKENNPEPAEKLLERIKEERQNRYEQELKDWKAEVKAWEKDGKKGRKPGKPRKPSNLEEKITFTEGIIKQERIPKEWKLSPLVFFSDNKPDAMVDGPFGSSINVNEDYKDDGIPVIRMINIRPFIYREENLKFIIPEKFETLRRHNVISNDILIAKVGATIGDCCIYPAHQPEGMLSTTGSCRIRIDNKIVIGKILEYFIHYHKNNLKDIASQTAQPFLNMSMLKSYPFPLIHKNEQEIIAQYLEQNFSIIDNLELNIKIGLQKSEALRQSILKKAFEGKLVPQDPNDEPASELLKRIQAEKKKYLEEQKQQKKKKSPKTLNHA